MEPATATQRDQWLVEYQIRQIYDIFSTIPRNAQSVMLEIQRDSHIEYLTKGLEKLGPSFCVLDANRPWLCYWILHSIALLGESVDDNLKSRTIDFLNRCQDPNGGYGGGPGQLPHLATTYAAVNALITLGSEEAFYQSIGGQGKLYSFLKKMKDPSGAFRMHDGGEIDVRACYTAISVASVLNILDNELVQDVGDYILSCQTFEGGISGEPGSEAHGGYTFCGLAAMILIDEVHRLDLPSLLDWVVYRQSGAECGFQGRTNKLVDGCYSFWQGGVCALSQRLRLVINRQLGLSDADEYSDTDTSETDIDIREPTLEKDTDIQEGDATQVPEICPTKSGVLHNASSPVKFKDVGYEFIKGHARMEPLYHSIALQQYIILCSQLQDGGFRDKPGKGRDFYHTCYCLSGLSVSQYAWSRDEKSAPLPRAVLGPYDNLLETVHPLYNVVLGRYYDAHNYYFHSKTPSQV